MREATRAALVFAVAAAGCASIIGIGDLGVADSGDGSTNDGMAGDDAQGDVRSDAPAADGADATPGDASADAYDASDGFDGCTKFPQNLTGLPSAPCQSVSNAIDIPAGIAWDDLSCEGGPSACCSFADITPKPCQCVETYDCACLQANSACALAAKALNLDAAFAWVTCNQSPDATPTITCQ